MRMLQTHMWYTNTVYVYSCLFLCHYMLCHLLSHLIRCNVMSCQASLGQVSFSSAGLANVDSWAFPARPCQRTSSKPLEATPLEPFSQHRTTGHFFPPKTGKTGKTWKREAQKMAHRSPRPQEVPNRSPRGLLGGPLEVQISAKARSSWFFWQPTSARQGPGCGNMWQHVSLLMVDSGGLMDVNGW